MELAIRPAVSREYAEARSLIRRPDVCPRQRLLYNTYTGVALWLAPGVRADEEAMTELVWNTVPPSIRDDACAVFEQMAHYHPEEPHWHLPLIGVDPAHQGKGIGDALMKHALRRCDHDHVPAYLESTNPRNISLYRRHGFEELGTIQVGSSPPLVPMLRLPRSE